MGVPVTGDNLYPDREDLQDEKLRTLEKALNNKPAEPRMEQISEEEDLRPLSRKEIASVRDLLDRDRRARWLWASLRVWALWIAAVLGAWVVGWESLGRLVRTLAGKGAE